MKPEIKALFVVLGILIGSYLIATLIHYVSPVVLLWAFFGLMCYGIYTFALGYFKFAENVDSLTKKQEDK